MLFANASASTLLTADLFDGITLINTWEQVLLLFMVLIIMFGMGCTLRNEDFKQAIQRPRGVFIGFISQFGMMPLLALGTAIVLDLPPAMAIALILVGCLPGGSTSNMFTYFSRGSLALSISMTVASTLMALILMPILLGFYSADYVAMIAADRIAAGETPFEIPYVNIIVSLLTVVIPVVGGMYLLRKSPAWAKTFEDTAGFMGIIVILFLLGSVMIRHTELLLQTPWQVYMATIMLGPCGFLIGYILATLSGIRPRYKRAISLETGIQNGPLAFAIIMLSFAGDAVHDPMLWMAILYSAFIVMTSSFVTLFFRKIGKTEDDIYRNIMVHQRVFGPDYKTQS